jgi:parvulin-like peptidyl-prolyl isomerase
VANTTKVPNHVVGEDYQVCEPFKAFHAWAIQFIIFCRENKDLDKLNREIKGLERELEDKVEKSLSLQNIVDAFTKDGYITLFEREIAEDKQRIAQYEKLQKSMADRAGEEQRTYQNFERQFFKELEEFVVRKKGERATGK